MTERLDHATLDWDLVARGRTLHQTFRYEYDRRSATSATGWWSSVGPPR